MSGLFVSQPPFPSQVWPDYELNQDSADRPGELLRPLTRSCFLLLVLGRLFLLASCLPPCPPWNLPSFTVESTLSSPCSRSDPPHARQGAALAHLDSPPLMTWYSGQTALFLFLLARVAPAYLPTALSVALRPLFPFRQAQFAPVFPLKPALFCTPSAAP